MKYQKENSQDFFEKIDELNDKDRYTECINLLESMPKEERDYQVCYQLARTYQNFAVIGDDNEGTPEFIGCKALLKSIDILNSVKEKGKDKAEWNMRMAYGYQYLNNEEKAIPYAMRWAEIDSADENALGVIKECKEEVERRKQRVCLSAEEATAQEKIEINVDWGVYLCNAFAYDLPAVIRVNLGLSDFELTSKYSKRLKLQILYKNANKTGFPTMEEKEYLYRIEDDMLEIIEKHGDILAGVVKCDERVHIFAYAKNVSGYADEISEMMAENFPDYVYTFAAVEDKEWDMYFNALYPNRYEYQSIMNMRLIEAIKNEGDSMVPRIIEHWLYFETEGSREEFLTKAKEKGFQKLESRNNDDSEDRDNKLVIGREDD